MRSLPLLFALMAVACGGETSPLAPSPQPVPAQPAPIIAPDPALFDATFNAQLVHNALEQPGLAIGWRGFSGNPAIYLQSAGLSATTVASLEAEARAIIPAYTGGALAVASFTDTGADLHAMMRGAIVVELVSDLSTTWCGLTDEAAPAGHVRMNIALGVHANGQVCLRELANTLGHELGHALGFYHVADPSALMSTARPLSHNGLPNDKERYHAGLAYQSNGAYRESLSVPRVIID